MSLYTFSPGPCVCGHPFGDHKDNGGCVVYDGVWCPCPMFVDGRRTGTDSTTLTYRKRGHT